MLLPILPHNLLVTEIVTGSRSHTCGWFPTLLIQQLNSCIMLVFFITGTKGRVFFLYPLGSMDDEDKEMAILFR